MISNRFVFLLLIGFLLSLSCVRYSFKGALPSNLKTIYIYDFENRTEFAGVREVLSQKLAQAFIQDNSLKVVNSESAADLILKGTVTSIRKQPVAFTEQEVVQQFKMVVNVKAECFNVHTNKPLWSGTITRYGLMSGEAIGEEVDAAIADALSQIVEDILIKTIAAW